MPRRLALVLVLALAGFPACRGPAAPDARWGEASILVVSIDTLRADHLPAYGYATGRTPVIDRLAREGIVFENAYSAAPLTLPSHASILTGLLPAHHGVADNLGFVLDASHETLATRLTRAGWRSGAAVSSYVLRRETGIGRGFEFWDDQIERPASLDSLGTVQRDGDASVTALTQWIAGLGESRFLAFLHLYEPHTPYAPPPRFRDIPAPYDGEIAYADELLGRLLASLEPAGRLDRMVVVVLSDHGEGLGDHGEQEHGIFLYREAVHVPLLVRLPGRVQAGRRVKTTASLVDVVPTILDLIGKSADGVDGRTLRPSLLGRPLDDMPAYSETEYPRLHFGWSALRAMSDGQYRYIDAPRDELFDAVRDPQERRNLAADRPGAATAMRGWIAAHRGSQVEPRPVSSEVRERLASLGYIGSSAAKPATGDLPDPKDRIQSYEQLRQALTARDRGDLDAAIRQLQTLTADQPAMPDAWEALATCLVKAGRTGDAVAAFERVLALDPAKPETHLALARIHAVDGRPDRAVAHATIAADASPADGFEVLATLSLDAGDLAGARTFAERSLAADPGRAMSQFVIGVAAQRSGRCDAAIEAYRAALAGLRREPHTIIRSLHANLGDCLARSNRATEAEQEFRRELALVPDSQEASVGLAMLYRSAGRDEDARRALSDLMKAQRQPSADAYLAVVRALTVLGDRDEARRWTSLARQRFPSDRRFR